MTLSTIPEFSTIDLAFVKDYLYVDFDDDDTLIQLFIYSAQEVVLFETGYDDIKLLDSSRLASVVMLSIVSDFYNSRSTTATDVKVKFSPLFSEIKKTLRGQTNGYRLGNIEE